MFPGALPRAWSCPALGPQVRRSLKPPLLQQAAFDDLVFRVDVMRNVASKHQMLQNETADNLKSAKAANVDKPWTSLPALELAEKQNFRDEENGDEGLQEVAGKLEIRVVPKPITDAVTTATTYQGTANSPLTNIRPQSLPPITTKILNGQSDKPVERKPVERTKSILKQGSKEGNSGAAEIGSPRKEVVIFADGLVEKKEKDKVSSCGLL